LPIVYRHAQVSNVLGLESALFRLVGAPLSAMGQTVRSMNGGNVGGVQWLMYTANADGSPGGVYRAGSDFRKDGQAAGW